MRARTLTGILTLSAASVFIFLSAGDAPSQPPGPASRFEVTVTNITNAQQFTPLLVVAHDADLSLFQLGDPASPEMTALAEFGMTMPFETALRNSRDVFDFETSSGLLDPGESVTVTVETEAGPIDDLTLISLAGMLIPTNDAFVAVNSVPAPRAVGSTIRLRALAYDAGTEVNDELCSSIPGPSFSECGGPGGGGSPGGGEGHVHVHRGMQGVGDMDAEIRDWRNPVAAVSIRAVQ